MAAQDVLWYGADLTAEAQGAEAEPAVRALPAASPVPLEAETAAGTEPSETGGGRDPGRER